jgi:hypothetical protein
MAGKPRILVLSSDGETEFRWMSDGWNDEPRRGTPEAAELMAKAKECASSGKNVPDIVRLLKDAGFEVVRTE